MRKRCEESKKDTMSTWKRRTRQLAYFWLVIISRVAYSLNNCTPPEQNGNIDEWKLKFYAVKRLTIVIGWCRSSSFRKYGNYEEEITHVALFITSTLIDITLSLENFQLIFFLLKFFFLINSSRTFHIAWTK